MNGSHMHLIVAAWLAAAAVCGCRSESRKTAINAKESSPDSAPATIERDPRYPAQWWAPVPKEGAPGWEILPQEAGPGEVILSKRHELGLLSNFAATPFEFRGKNYASLEGFWQMMMYPKGQTTRGPSTQV